MTGISRRELLKRSAVVGGVVWAAPVLTSAAAWAATPSGGACDCDGTLIYTKWAGSGGGDAQTCQNQCLAPGDIGRYDFSCLERAGIVTETITTQSNNSQALVAFSSDVKVDRLAVKATSSCLMVTCDTQFTPVFNFTNADQGEPRDSFLPSQTSAIFTFSSKNGSTVTPCGNSNTGATCTEVRRISFDTTSLNQTLNFFEFILCLRNNSRIPCVPANCKGK